MSVLPWTAPVNVGLFCTPFAPVSMSPGSGESGPSFLMSIPR
jgi:hypothetical protein